MNDQNRRDFFKKAGLALTASSYSRILGANERVNHVVVGLGGRGQNHMDSFMKVKECMVMGVCDVNQAARERAIVKVEKGTGQKPKEYDDMRKVFADKSVDSVSMPTPNHWHALGAIWAMQAGKDVYVEKPASHEVWEGWKMIEAARKYKRMCQVGSQSRSIPHMIRAAKLLQEGVIGELYMAKGLCFKRRKSIGHKENEPVPAGLNWDMFLGPAPMRPYNELRFRYNWHWFWDTGNGDIGNQGVHQMDIARWGMGNIGLPNSVVSTGGKYVYTDDQETPNTQNAVFDYGGKKQIVFEVRGLLTGDEGSIARRGGNTIGNLFYGSDGWMALDGAGFQVYKGENNEKTMDEKPTRGGAGEDVPHFKNFIDAVKSRDYKSLHAEIEIGAMSAALGNLANIAYRAGRKLNFDPVKRQFINDREADKMLTRDYRKPYVVPDKV